MPYWQNVTRSFVIIWRHKYLWLLGLFAGEGGGSMSFNYSSGTGRNGTGSPAALAQQATQWINQHLALIIGAAIVWLILVVVLFFIGAVCEGAIIRGAAEHDADRPFGLREAWTMGVHTMWLMVRFRLLLIALGLIPVLVVAAVIAGGVIAATSDNGGLAVLLISVGVLLGLALIVYLVYLGFLDRFGARTAILEEQPAVASLRHAHRLLFKRLGRSLLVWLLSIAVSFVAGIASAVVLVVAAIPLLAGIFASIAGGTVVWPLIVIGGIVVVIVALPIAAVISAQASTYWTLAFRRMDLDFPSPAYPYPPPAGAQ